MSSATIEKDIFKAIESEYFVVSELTDKYSRDKLAEAIVDIVSNIRTAENDMSKRFSESELQNFYSLTANIMFQRTIEEKTVKNGLQNNKQHAVDKALIPQTIIDYMYKLKPAPQL